MERKKMPDFKNLMLITYNKFPFKHKYKVNFYFDESVSQKVIIDTATLNTRDITVEIAEMLNVLKNEFPTEKFVVKNKSRKNYILCNQRIMERCLCNIEHNNAVC